MRKLPFSFDVAAGRTPMISLISRVFSVVINASIPRCLALAVLDAVSLNRSVDDDTKAVGGRKLGITFNVSDLALAALTVELTVSRTVDSAAVNFMM